MARPGPFCPAMVTITSGTAMPMMACRSKVGVVQTGPERSSVRAGAWAWPVTALRTAPTTMATRTAYRGVMRRPIRKATTSPPATMGEVTTASTAFRTNGSSTPANTAAMTGFGTMARSRPNQPVTPMIRASKAATT